MQGITRIKPSPAELKQWGTTIAALRWNSPAFSYIFYTMLDPHGTEHLPLFTSDLPRAATDGSTLIINPAWFFKLPLNQRVFVCGHEILHCVLQHLVMCHRFKQTENIVYPDGTKIPYHHQLMNQAMDYVINDILIDSKCGEFVPEGCHDKSIATAADSCLDTYRKIYEKCSGNPGGIPGTGSFDEHLAPGSAKGQDPTQASQNHSPGAWNAAINAAITTQRLQGHGPGTLERIFGEVLEPKVDWKEKIQSCFARRLGSGRTDWRNPDKHLIVRDIYAPGKAGFGAGTVVIGADTSGSIGAPELDMFMAEVSGILEEVNPERLIIMWCDDEVNHVDDGVETDDLNTIRREGRKGGGGTSFVPVFDKIAEMGLDVECLAYLTDGHGDFPAQAPKYPVIWGSIDKKPDQYPFGDVVEVPKQAA